MSLLVILHKPRCFARSCHAFLSPSNGKNFTPTRAIILLASIIAQKQHVSNLITHHIKHYIFNQWKLLVSWLRTTIHISFGYTNKLIWILAIMLLNVYNTALSPYLTGLRLFCDNWRQTSRVARKAVSKQSPVIRNFLA